MVQTYTAPSWTPALRSLMTGMTDNQPIELLPTLALFNNSTPVSEDDLATWVRDAYENDSTLTQMRIALAGWDASQSADLAGTPKTQDRRRAVYEKLGLAGPALVAIDGRIPVAEEADIVISDEFTRWYDAARAERTTVYWNHYSNYLRDKKGWGGEAIASLDEASTQVVKRLSDPCRADAKRSKGLVVGYVQSGKTANFTGVTAKAIDAGYRLVIVLTGTIEILRAQTQRRMDMELIGVENILAGGDVDDPNVQKEQDYLTDEDWIRGNFVSHGPALEQDNVPAIRRATTLYNDYRRLPQGISQFRFSRADRTKPLNARENLPGTEAYVAIVKKESNRLGQLIQDLKPLKDRLKELPVLIIDDEADVASPDTTDRRSLKATTNAGKRTAINKKIREILDLCPRAQYVGYTATPYANVLIDPGDEIDLFPTDFVISLRRPPGYMGVQEFHDVGTSWDGEDPTVKTSNEKAHIRYLEGDPEDDVLTRDHELREAIDAWVLSGAIKKYRQETEGLYFKHHTMLVHESVRTTVHADAASAVRVAWKQAAHSTSAGLTRLEKLFREDFQPVMMARPDGHHVPKTFEELEPYIGEVLQEIRKDSDPVLVVNSDKEIQANQKALDFQADKVWKILVGGTQLSRGFTVEGLTVSYYRRKAGQADTLMQAGRWFGFRHGYRDLVRLYMPEELYRAFEALLIDEEHFRAELRKFEGLDENDKPLMLPVNIPPKVQQSLAWLKPTARNKMYNAVIASEATTGGFKDLYGIPTSTTALRKNLTDVGIPLLQQATTLIEVPRHRGPALPFRIGTMSGSAFVELLDRHVWQKKWAVSYYPTFRFLRTATDDGRIKEWVIVWHQPEGVEDMKIEGLGIVPVVRRSRRERLDFPGSDRKHANSVLPLAQGVGLAGLSPLAGRGVVMAYLAYDPKLASKPTSEDLFVLLSVAMPDASVRQASDKIYWAVEAPHDKLKVLTAE
ncbi:Z1 domain-containing protein [Kocuria sp. CPCC 205263]|uniref:Z1 domain-containing protein n=1 Tax=Kocuria sp. CPCC 205263 TaxID=3073555 RepID=UPI0034D76C84